MKKLKMIGCVVCVMLMLVGCNTKKEPSYDETAVLSKTEELIQKIDAQKYEEALSNVADELASFTPDKLKSAMDGLGEKGAFVSFDEHEMVVQKGIAVMGIIVKYEHMRLQYTISFDEDMKLAGLYVKPV